MTEMIERVVKASDVRFCDRLLNEPGRPLVMSKRTSLNGLTVTFVLDAVGASTIAVGVDTPVRIRRRVTEHVDVDGEDYSAQLLRGNGHGSAAGRVRRPQR